MGGGGSAHGEGCLSFGILSILESKAESEEAGAP